MSINDFVEHIFCINLDRRPDRWIRSQEIFFQNNIKNVIRVSAVDGNMLNKPEHISSAQAGCSLSHLSILKKQIENKWERVLVFEDDVWLSTNMEHHFELAMPHCPPVFDLLYLGGWYQYKTRINPYFSKVWDAITTHAYFISLSYAKFIVPLVEKLDKPVDVVYAQNQKEHNCYGFDPCLARQRVGFSDVDKEIKNLNRHMPIAGYRPRMPR